MTTHYSSICPFTYRYGSTEMKKILERCNILRKFIEVEAALMKALETVGIAPKECYKKVLDTVSEIRPEDIDELEKVIGHDIASLAILIAKHCGECGKYVHLGATSYDIVDTAWALIVRDALGIIKSKLRKIIEKTIELTIKHQDTLIIGRTHGQHALPITFGFKLANYIYELSRSYERLCELEKRVLRCKMSGAVGTMAAWGDKGLHVESTVSQVLQLEPHAIATQVAPRDGFAELISALAILASQMDRLALEIRELSRPEIAELDVAYTKVGSSTMPHKKNPVIAERISGLAKITRALVTVALENIPLMHERDLTNSSSERFLIPHALLVIDQVLIDAYNMLENLKINEEAMKKNLELSKGTITSECLMVKLVLKANIPRHEAHMLLVDLSNKALNEKRSFKEIVFESNIAALLTKKDIEECFDLSSYLGSYKQLIYRAINYAKNVMKRC